MRAKSVRAFHADSSAGYNLTEFVVTLAIAMVLLAIALPAFLRAYNGYALSDSADQVRQILLQARYAAIKLNKQVDFAVQASSSPGRTNAWVDSNRNGFLDPGETMFLLGPRGNLIDSSGVPGTPSLIAQAMNGNGAVAATPSATNSAITFDARGAVTSTNWNIYYLASAAPDAGYRAVILAPSGWIQIWISDSAGNWQRLS
jgi:Tfp pilus assembly protein FimT